MYVVCEIECVCTLMCVIVSVLALCPIGGGQRKILGFAFQLAGDRNSVVLLLLVLG